MRRERSLRIFLDTSVLSHSSLGQISSMLADRVLSGDEILVSVLTHYEILWGYRKIGLPTARYEAFLSGLDIEVAPLVQEDAVVAANKKPSREKLVDALIAATVSRYDASIWTRDSDFLHFLPKEKVILQG